MVAGTASAVLGAMGVVGAMVSKLVDAGALLVVTPAMGVGVAGVVMATCRTLTPEVLGSNPGGTSISIQETKPNFKPQMGPTEPQ